MLPPLAHKGQLMALTVPGVNLWVTKGRRRGDGALAWGQDIYELAWYAAAAAAAAKSLQLCPTLCDPMDGSPPGSSVPGILQARIVAWV